MDDMSCLALDVEDILLFWDDVAVATVAYVNGTVKVGGISGAMAIPRTRRKYISPPPPFHSPLTLPCLP